MVSRRRPSLSLHLGRAAGLLLVATSAVSVEPLWAQGGPTLQALRLRGTTARPAALLMSGQAGGPVPLAVLAVAAPGEGDAAYVGLVVELDAAALAAEHPAGDLRFELYVYALDDKGAPRGTLSHVVTVPPAALAGQNPPGLRFRGHLELSRGAYDLRVLALAPASGKFGLARQSLWVPDYEQREQALFPPLLPVPPDEPWLQVREAPHGRISEAFSPFKNAEGAPFEPAARPVLRPGQPSEVFLLGHRIPDDGRPAVNKVEGVGELKASVALEAVQPVRDPRGGIRGWRARAIATASGTGLARWRFEGGAGAALPTPLEVWLDAAPAGHAWVARFIRADEAQSALELAASPREPEAESGAQRGRLKVRELEQVRAAYTAALVRLGAGERSAALEAIAELERSTLAGRPAGAVEGLAKAQLSALAPFAVKDPEILPAVADLHLSLFERSAADRRFLLAAHGRAHFRQLVELYVEKVRTPAGRALAAELLVVFGGALQEAGAGQGSEEAFERALELVPEQRVALLGLATAFERDGRPQEAADALERLRKLTPDDAETCARLGRNLARAGSAGRAAETLARCTSLGEPRWAVAVAYQELARMRIAADDWGGAVALLDRAVDQLPEEISLALTRAYALDRLGRPADGRAAVGRVGATQEPGLSPRQRYAGWRREAFQTIQGELEPRLDESRSRLSRVLLEVGS